VALIEKALSLRLTDPETTERHRGHWVWCLGSESEVEWITIVPDALSAPIPEIVFDLRSANAAAPTITGVMNSPAPPHGILTARSTVCV
jgi:hypothetical protein